MIELEAGTYYENIEINKVLPLKIHLFRIQVY